MDAKTFYTSISFSPTPAENRVLRSNASPSFEPSRRGPAHRIVSPQLLYCRRFSAITPFMPMACRPCPDDQRCRPAARRCSSQACIRTLESPWLPALSGSTTVSTFRNHRCAPQQYFHSGRDASLSGQCGSQLCAVGRHLIICSCRTIPARSPANFFMVSYLEGPHGTGSFWSFMAKLKSIATPSRAHRNDQSAIRAADRRRSDSLTVDRQSFPSTKLSAPSARCAIRPRHVTQHCDEVDATNFRSSPRPRFAHRLKFPSRRDAIISPPFPPAGESVDALNQFRSAAQQRLILRRIFLLPIKSRASNRKLARRADASPSTCAKTDRDALEEKCLVQPTARKNVSTPKSPRPRKSCP